MEMDARHKALIEKMGKQESDFQRNDEQPTMQDVVEALNTLTDMVLGGEE